MLSGCCPRTSSAITDGASDIDFMLRIGLFRHVCASGIFPTLGERQAAPHG